MNPLDWIHQTFRDHARDDVCRALQELGVRAELADRGRKEEKFSRWGKSLGVIDVLDRQISWVGVKRLNDNEEGNYWYVEYGVHDERVAGAFPKVEIETSKARARLWKTPLRG